MVPNELKGRDAKGEPVSVASLWNRRTSTKFNGVSYPVQRGAEAIYGETGRKEVQANIDYYMANAAIIRAGLGKAGFQTFGGVNAPYVWMKTPE